MKLSFDFPAGWWVVLLITYGLFIFLFLYRKSYQKREEIKAQLIFALVTLLLSFIVEVVGVNSHLWTYFPTNWPLIIWIGYFGVGLLGYQLVKKIEEILKWLN